jgi:multiple sugar transport system permease protein
MSVSERSLRTGVEPPVDAAGDGQVDGARPGGRRRLTERARAERNLAWKLCAPAVVVMLLVTAYPIVYAVWLSLQKYDLRFPDEREFVGLANYGDVLSSSLWWDDLFTTSSSPPSRWWWSWSWASGSPC